MASDGLWDVLSNEEVFQIVNTSLNKINKDDLQNMTATLATDEMIK